MSVKGPDEVMSVVVAEATELERVTAPALAMAPMTVAARSWRKPKMRLEPVVIMSPHSLRLGSTQRLFSPGLLLLQLV